MPVTASLFDGARVMKGDMGWLVLLCNGINHPLPEEVLNVLAGHWSFSPMGLRNLATAMKKGEIMILYQNGVPFKVVLVILPGSGRPEADGPRTQAIGQKLRKFLGAEMGDEARVILGVIPGHEPPFFDGFCQAAGFELPASPPEDAA